MHYEIDYTELTPEVKQRQALADLRSYIGEERWQILELHRETIFKTAQSVRNTFGFMMGVEGYPVTAWMEVFRPDLLLEESNDKVVSLPAERLRREARP